MFHSTNKAKIEIVTTDMSLSHVSVPFKNDTGASVSIINDETLETLKKKGMKLSISMVKLRTYSGHSGQYLIPMEEIKVNVTYGNQNCIHSFVVVEGKSQNLMGRYLLMKCRLNWQNLFTKKKTECVFSIVNDK